MYIEDGMLVQLLKLHGDGTYGLFAEGVASPSPNPTKFSLDSNPRIRWHRSRQNHVDGVWAVGRTQLKYIVEILE